MVLAATVRIHGVVFPNAPGVGPSFPAEATKRIPFSHAQSSFLSYTMVISFYASDGIMHLEINIAKLLGK